MECEDGGCYLTKRTSKILNLGCKTLGNVTSMTDDFLDANVEEPEDKGEIAGDVGEISGGEGEIVGEVCTFDHHILYSTSYSVPVLYYNVYRRDGSLLSLEELWETLPILHKSRMEADRWSFVTQQEHPILRRPFYQLHPCKTSDLLHLVNCVSGGEIANVIVSWLSTVASVVHLDLPPQYAVIQKNPGDNDAPEEQ